MAESAAARRTTVVIERIFDAPRELVWRALTDPERVKKWWGPEHYDCPAAKIDLRVGGSYRFAMRGPDGQTNWSGGVYREIVPLERIVWTDSFMDEDGNRIPASQLGIPGDWLDEQLVTMTLEDIDGKTKLTLHHEDMPNEMAEDATAGWNSSLDKLAASLR